MSILEVKEIIRVMNRQFDAHDFILKFIQVYTHSYFQLLDRNNRDIRLVDAYIGSFLQAKAGELGISEIGKVISKNIMSNETKCMLWEKF
ncbi:MAG: hypothetical protein IKY82_06575 [Alistipes sp.]|nr:hypothetical protein [Alistipes sp.]